MGIIHSQSVFNYKHPRIREGEEGELLLRAFRRDFEVNGPSVVRIIRSVLRAWKRFKNHPNARIRERFAYDASNLPCRYSGELWATRKYYDGDTQRVAEISGLLDEIYKEFGLGSRLATPWIGRYLYRKLVEQQKRLDSGWTCEPPTFYETNQDRNKSAVRVEGIQTAQVDSNMHDCREHSIQISEIGCD